MMHIYTKTFKALLKVKTLNYNQLFIPTFCKNFRINLFHVLEEVKGSLYLKFFKRQ